MDKLKAQGFGGTQLKGQAFVAEGLDHAGVLHSIRLGPKYHPLAPSVSSSLTSEQPAARTGRVHTVSQFCHRNDL